MKCPKCKAELEPLGELTVEGVHFVVYQCDTCIVPWKLGSSTFDTALTFAVDASGRMINPETFESLSLN